jgi:protein-tyrosine-phosphatase
MNFLAKCTRNYVWEVNEQRFLQVLFIDQSDTLRARLASGLFDRIAEWNGYGRALYAWTCGLHADQPSGSDSGGSSSFDKLSTQASLMHKAWMLGIPPKIFARPVEQFELADLDRYDVVVAMDSSVRQQILQAVDPAFTGTKGVGFGV